VAIPLMTGLRTTSLVQNVLHEIAHDLGCLVGVLFSKLVDVIADRVVEHGDNHAPAALDDAGVLVNGDVELGDLR